MLSVCKDGELCDGRGIRVAKSAHDNHGERIIVPCDCQPKHSTTSLVERIVERMKLNKWHRKRR